MVQFLNLPPQPVPALVQAAQAQVAPDPHGAPGQDDAAQGAPTPPIPASVQVAPQPVTLPRQSNLSKFSQPATVLKSEILWSIVAADEHLSNRQVESISKQFKHMFPDSDIAQRYRMGKDRAGYLQTYGLGNTLENKVYDIAKNAGFISISYDESLNKVRYYTINT